MWEQVSDSNLALTLTLTQTLGDWLRIWCDEQKLKVGQIQLRTYLTHSQVVQEQSTKGIHCIERNETNKRMQWRWYKGIFQSHTR